MPSELENAMKSAAASAAKYVQDASELLVETRYVEISAAAAIDFAQAKPVARTIVRLDGDSETILPARKNEAGAMEVDVTLFELHQQNVNTAIEYRAKILNALLGALQRRAPGI
jgi:hypothetical protein